MSEKLKNILLSVAAVIVIVILARLAWSLAGFVVKLLLSAAIFVVLVGLVLYFYNQFRAKK